MIDPVKDATGREIKVGDWVAYATGTTTANLTIAKVVELIPVEIEEYKTDPVTKRCTRIKTGDQSLTVKTTSFVKSTRWDRASNTSIPNKPRRNTQKFDSGYRFVVLSGPPSNLDPELIDYYDELP